MTRLVVTSVASCVAVMAILAGYMLLPDAITQYYPEGSGNFMFPIVWLLGFVGGTVSLWRSGIPTWIKVIGTLVVLVSSFMGAIFALMIVFHGING